ncbi:MAG TPA: hypothetical protein PLM53_00735 [Spirochaetota bacterium]|nr:hypothetical protein [Spirochaetota bacterium]HPC39450.1 hypothetical protein [Spirochaetota bacterium]HPL15886.1 hypothetical protein [Spirochaetota bacterium]HQF06787.1 hypothetical protein [Spirochaetota bacterium]HQH95594.1 hypothetical protein [Spirochaetota bacterium]
MKRFIIFALILTAGLLMALTSCSSKKIGGTVEGESYTMEGWIDDDTYQLAAAGVPTKTLTNVVQRKEASKRAAILNAQYQVIEKFKGSKIEGASGMENFEMTGIAVAQELKAIAKGGSVKKVTWDEEQNCEIIYVVHAKGLKKKVSAAKWD